MRKRQKKQWRTKSRLQTVTDLVPKITEEYPDLAVVDALTDEEINAFKKAVAPIYSDYRDSMGEELFAKFGYNF